MFNMKLAAVFLGALAATSNAGRFEFVYLSSRDNYYNQTSSPFTDNHSVRLSLQDVDAPPGGLGTEPHSCSISWDDGETIPACWTACSSSEPKFWARITPATYQSAANFSLDLSELYGDKGEGTLNYINNLPLAKRARGLQCYRPGGNGTKSLSCGYMDRSTFGEPIFSVNYDTVAGNGAFEPSSVCDYP